MKFKTFLKESHNIPKLLNLQEIKAYVASGSIPIHREEGYTPGWGPMQNRKGVYYYVGDSNSKQLPLGNCLVANNKAHAVEMLGIKPDFLLKKLNWRLDRSKEDAKDPNLQKQFLDGFRGGNVKHRLLDQFDYILAALAKKSGYNTIILSKEPNTYSHGQATEVIDLNGVEQNYVYLQMLLDDE